MFARAWVGVLLAGCSIMQIDRPPRAVRAGDRQPGPDCTAAKAWPVVDAVAAGVGVGGGLGIAVGKIERTEMDGTKTPLSTDEKWIFGSLAIVEGVLFAVSSYYGFQTTAACRDMHARLSSRVVPAMGSQ